MPSRFGLSFFDRNEPNTTLSELARPQIIQSPTIPQTRHYFFLSPPWRTIAGYEAIHMIRKGQACWSAAEAKVGLLHRFILGLFAATS